MAGIRRRKDESEDEYQARRGAWKAESHDTPPEGHKPTSQERRSRLADIRAWLLSLNQVLQRFAPDDALTEQPMIVGRTAEGEALVQEAEVVRLSEAFDAWQASSAKVHKAVMRMLDASPGVALLVCCVGIALPRLERRGMLSWTQAYQAEPKPEAPPNGAVHEWEQEAQQYGNPIVGAP